MSIIDTLRQGMAARGDGAALRMGFPVTVNGPSVKTYDNETLFYSETGCAITSRRLVLKGRTIAVDIVKAAWIGPKAIALWPGTVLVGTGFLMRFGLWEFLTKHAAGFGGAYPHTWFVLIVLGGLYVVARHGLCKSAVYIADMDGDAIPIAVSRDPEHLAAILDAVNAAMVTIARL